MNPISYAFRSTHPLTKLSPSRPVNMSEVGMIVRCCGLGDLEIVHKWLSKPWLNLCWLYLGLKNPTQIVKHI